MYRIKSAVLVICSIILFFSSCVKHNDRRISYAERQAVRNPEKADTLIGEISLNLLDSIQPPHNLQCISNVYLAKAILLIKDNEIEEAKQLFRKVIENDVLLYQTQKESDLLIAIDFEWLDSISSLSAPDCTDEQKMNVAQDLKARLADRLSNHIPIKQTLIQQSIYSNQFYAPILLIISIIVVSLLVYIKRSNKHSEDILKYQSSLVELNKKADSLSSMISVYEDKISSLDKHLKELKSATTEKLGRGKSIFDNVKNGGNMKNISIEDEQCFVDFYAFNYPNEFSNITRDYSSLSLRHTTYLILIEMGFSDSEIQNILFVKDSTIRNYRLRMNKKRKS